jgi:hypothetical protein
MIQRIRLLVALPLIFILIAFVAVIEALCGAQLEE